MSSFCQSLSLKWQRKKQDRIDTQFIIKFIAAKAYWHERRWCKLLSLMLMLLSLQPPTTTWNKTADCNRPRLRLRLGHRWPWLDKAKKASTKDCCLVHWVHTTARLTASLTDWKCSPFSSAFPLFTSFISCSCNSAGASARQLCHPRALFITAASDDDTSPPMSLLRPIFSLLLLRHHLCVSVCVSALCEQVSARSLLYRLFAVAFCWLAVHPQLLPLGRSR